MHITLSDGQLPQGDPEADICTKLSAEFHPKIDLALDLIDAHGTRRILLELN